MLWVYGHYNFINSESGKMLITAIAVLIFSSFFQTKKIEVEMTIEFAKSEYVLFQIVRMHRLFLPTFVGLGSEIQLQVGKNWNYLIQRVVFFINAQLFYTIQIQRHIQSITQKVKIGIES